MVTVEGLLKSPEIYRLYLTTVGPVVSTLSTEEFEFFHSYHITIKKDFPVKEGFISQREAETAISLLVALLELTKSTIAVRRATSRLQNPEETFLDPQVERQLNEGIRSDVDRAKGLARRVVESSNKCELRNILDLFPSGEVATPGQSEFEGE